MKPTPKPRRRRIIIIFILIVLLIVIIYLFTYVFAKKHNKVIYQDASRRIYLTKKIPYGSKNRVKWDMVYEDIKTGARSFVIGNAEKGYSEEKMCKRVLNTVDQNAKTSFDQVDRVGVTIIDAKTDIHSNLIAKKKIGDVIPSDLLEGFDSGGLLIKA